MFYPFKILFDCGIYTSQKPDYIFLTHQHVDHTQAIAHICTRHKKNVSNVYVPGPSVKYITKYERAISELSDPESETMTDNEILEYQKINLVPLNPSDCINITVGRQEFKVEVLKAYHDVQSNGYGFSSMKKRIKPEYEHLTKDTDDKQIKSSNINKIKELKNQGIDMYYDEAIPEFAFFCDSTIHNLSAESEWKKYPIVICECTGLDVEHCRNYDNNHTSLLTLKPIMLENRDKKWYLIHVSLGCSDEKIKQIESDLVKEGIDVSICM